MPESLVTINGIRTTHIWKVIYGPAQQRAGVYLVTNDDTRVYAVVTVSKLVVGALEAE